MRRAGLFFGLCLALSSPGIANSATALLVGGTGEYAVLSDEQMATAMGGYFAEYTRVGVPYPGLPDDFRYSLQVGTENLYAATYSTAGPKTIGGVSEGAPVVIEVLRRLAKDSTPPPPAELDAVILATLSRQFYWLTGVSYHDLPETPYNVKVVKAEYDGVADWPDNWLNPLAVINAIMGADQLHVASAFYDITTVPAGYVTSTTNSRGGVTTSFLIPTPVLPLLQPLVEAGASPETIEFLNTLLKPIIDSAYRRFWIRTSASAPVEADLAHAGSVIDDVERIRRCGRRSSRPAQPPTDTSPETMNTPAIRTSWPTIRHSAPPTQRVPKQREFMCGRAWKNLPRRSLRRSPPPVLRTTMNGTRRTAARRQTPYKTVRTIMTDRQIRLSQEMRHPRRAQLMTTPRNRMANPKPDRRDRQWHRRIGRPTVHPRAMICP